MGAKNSNRIINGSKQRKGVGSPNVNPKVIKDDTRLRGYAGRKQDHVLKIAMCLSSGDFHRVSKEDLNIEGWHILTALALLKKAEILMPKAFRGGLYSKQSKHLDRVIDLIKRAKRRGKNYPLPYTLMLKIFQKLTVRIKC